MIANRSLDISSSTEGAAEAVAHFDVGIALGGEPVFDPRRLQDMFGREVAVIAAVLGTFLESMRSNLADLDAAMATGGFVTMSKVAHRIKGAANMSGALGIAGAATHLEQAAGEIDASACRGAAAELARQWEALQADRMLRMACGSASAANAGR
ncbi:MAG: Hpt domain-containing protein [Burkholderiaceae bacterium]